MRFSRYRDAPAFCVTQVFRIAFGQKLFVFIYALLSIDACQTFIQLFAFLFLSGEYYLIVNRNWRARGRTFLSPNKAR